MIVKAKKMETPESTPEEEVNFEICMKRLRAVRDTLDVLNGRWKLPIMTSLLFGTKRFNQISKEMNGITDKMLSKELKDLELNKLVERNVQDTFPPTVEYTLTNHGKSLEKVIIELGNWGIHHRRKIIER